METVFIRITKLLDKQHVEYQIKEHPPTYTSPESAWHRGEPLKMGAKAMLLKTDDGFRMAVLSGDRRIDSAALKRLLLTKNLRFATAEELKEMTTLVPGAIPPFGSLFNLPMIVDQALLGEEYMAFNAGSLEKSIKMKVKDYVEVVKPNSGNFSK